MENNSKEVCQVFVQQTMPLVQVPVLFREFGTATYWYQDQYCFWYQYLYRYRYWYGCKAHGGGRYRMRSTGRRMLMRKARMRLELVNQKEVIFLGTLNH